ncbi:hypothetical protein HOLleu_20203 [Holothuria leucospilota]|uniref:HYR domain-containing protein n=1 Tax=Holothuria leucospilota TaxID=206669 RepID=A0A9Q1C1G9_HOLLE|nr:hypothetical protein HOLleu_20203 [Holothuria leucospilota]
MSACARIADTTVEEDDGTLSLFVTINPSVSVDVNVGLRVTGLSENEGSDFGEVPSSVSIPGGSGFTTAKIPIINDAEKESDEKFLVEIVSVSFPATRCEESSTATIVILKNDEGPMIVFCPVDIVVFAVPSRDRDYVRWEPDRSTAEEVSIKVDGPQESETVIIVGVGPTQVSYEAMDEFGRISTCQFKVSAIEITGNQVKKYFKYW